MKVWKLLLLIIGSGVSGLILTVLCVAVVIGVFLFFGVGCGAELTSSYIGICGETQAAAGEIGISGYSAQVPEVFAKVAVPQTTAVWQLAAPEVVSGKEPAPLPEPVCAVRFALHPATPSGAAIPGYLEILRFTVQAAPDCPIEIIQLNFSVRFTDRAHSGWGPENLQIRNRDGEILSRGIQANTLPEGDDAYDRILLSYDNFFVLDSEPVLLFVFVDTLDASAAQDDYVRAILWNARWRPVREGTPEESVEASGLPLSGGTLIF